MATRSDGQIDREKEPAGEFLFGSLSSPDGRIRHERVRRLGFFHDSALEPPIPVSGKTVEIKALAGTDLHIVTAHLHYTTDGSLPQAHGSGGATTTVPMNRSHLMWDTLTWAYTEEWCAQIPSQASGSCVKYAISARTAAGQQIYSPHFAEPLNLPPEELDKNLLHKLKMLPSPQIYEFTVVDKCTMPEWLNDAVIYQIMPDRFSCVPRPEFKKPKDKSGFFGGTIRGIIAQLDYLAELGINCIWLTPISPSPTYHGYDTTDHCAVEPRLGTPQDWDELCKEAHARAIRIILDFVANHLSSRHPAFIEAQNDQQSSKSGWFRFTGWPDRYESFFNVRSMPVVQSDHPGIRAYMTDSARFWLSHACDGFRLDHAHGLSHAFWSEFRQEVRKVSQECALIAEIPDEPPALRTYSGRMDGCLDFRMCELLRRFFASGTISVSQFHKEITHQLAYFDGLLIMPSFLDNHDMNRFLWACNGDKRKLRLAAMCQFTLPGPPVIYYGTEVGLSQEKGQGRLEEARLPMLWGAQQDAELKDFYRRLIDRRKAAGYATWKDREAFVLDDGRMLYGYRCGGTCVVLNNGDEPVEVSLPDSQEWRIALSSESDCLVDRTARTLHLPAYAGSILQPAE